MYNTFDSKLSKEFFFKRQNDTLENSQLKGMDRLQLDKVYSYQIPKKNTSLITDNTKVYEHKAEK